MKNFILPRIWVLVLLMSTTIFAQQNDCILGEWQFVSANGQPISGTMTFKSDNSFTLSMQGQIANGTYTVESDDLIMDVNGNQSMSKIQSCNSTSLKLYSDLDKATLVFSKEASGSKIEIVSAIYGNGAKTADVTKKLQELIDKGECNIWVRNHILLVDPAKGVQKHLKVVYKENGNKHEKSIVERQYFNVCEASPATVEAPPVVAETPPVKPVKVETPPAVAETPPVKPVKVEIPPAVAETPPVKPVKVEAEPITYKVIINSFGSQNIQIRKALRSQLGISLKRAYLITRNSTPLVVKEYKTKAEAIALKEALERAGGEIEIKN